MPLLAPDWAKANPSIIAYQALIEELKTARYLVPYLRAKPKHGYYLAGSGKASVGMATAVVEAWGPPISGLIVTKMGHGEPIPNTQVIESSHPIPDELSLSAGQNLKNFAESIPKGSQALYLLSGGSSSLVELLSPETTLDSLQAETQNLLRHGATIEETNAYRKSVSLAKAGKMASWFGGTDLEVLVLSDVMNDDLATIGSGPLFPHLPHQIVANNQLAIKILTQNLESQGLQVALGPRLEGDLAEVAKKYAELVRAMPSGTALVGGGEGTVKVSGEGIGGRCQHFALQAAICLQGTGDVTLLAGSTDGTDGPTNVAAAIINGQTATKTAQSYLENSDSHTFLQAADGLIYTGPTQSNINDVVIAVHI